MYEKKHALPSKKIHTPKGIARLTVTVATMAAMTGSSLISPFAAFANKKMMIFDYVCGNKL